MALSKEQYAEIVKLYYKHNSTHTVIRMISMPKKYPELRLKLNRLVKIWEIRFKWGREMDESAGTPKAIT